MPRVSETYTGQFLTAGELGAIGQHRTALVHACRVELVGTDRSAKLILSLVSPGGKLWPKDVVLNKTNALHLQAAYGDDTDAWTGKRIEIWAENVQFQGRIVPGIRLLPAAAQSQVPAPLPAIPTNGQGRAVPMPGPVVYPPLVSDEPPAVAAVLDDDIPF